jgi:hypothetical protein
MGCKYLLLATLVITVRIQLRCISHYIICHLTGVALHMTIIRKGCNFTYVLTVTFCISYLQIHFDIFLPTFLNCLIILAATDSDDFILFIILKYL